MGPYCCPAIILHCSNSFTLLFLDDYFTPSLQFSNLHSLPPHHSYLDNFAFCFTDKIEVVRAFPQVPTHAFINTVLFLNTAKLSRLPAEANSFLSSRYLPLLPTREQCSRNSPAFPLQHQNSPLYWIISIGLQTCDCFSHLKKQASDSPSPSSTPCFGSPL